MGGWCTTTFPAYLQVRVAAGGVEWVSLLPSCRAGVILPCAHMVQPCEGDILVAIRAVPQKRLLNPLGMGADGVAPAFIGTRFEASAI